MTFDEALIAALAIRPDGRPGVTRLCQELLAQATGRPLRHPPPEKVERRRGTENIGGKGNRVGPWGGHPRKEPRQ